MDYAPRARATLRSGRTLFSASRRLRCRGTTRWLLVGRCNGGAGRKRPDVAQPLSANQFLAALKKSGVRVPEDDPGAAQLLHALRPRSTAPPLRRRARSHGGSAARCPRPWGDMESRRICILTALQPGCLRVAESGAVRRALRGHPGIPAFAPIPTPSRHRLVVGWAAAYGRQHGSEARTMQRRVPLGAPGWKSGISRYWQRASEG
jgi:hypothetical protein